MSYENDSNHVFPSSAPCNLLSNYVEELIGVFDDGNHLDFRVSRTNCLNFSHRFAIYYMLDLPIQSL